jgi:hypothetical protein
MTNAAFVQQLNNDINQIVGQVEKTLQPQPLDVLNAKKDTSSWSALECLEHLNRYHHYYFPLVAQAVAEKRNGRTDYQPRWLGKKFIKMMDPVASKKMKTVGRMNPTTPSASSQLSMETLNQFLDNQKALLKLLPQLTTIDVNRKCIAVEFFKPLKMSIGDTLVFLLTHEKRHTLQAEKAVAVKQ